MSTKDISLVNNKNHLSISIKSAEISELENVMERLGEYIVKLKKEFELENDFLLAAKKLETSDNLRVVIQRKAFKRPPLYKFKDKGVWKSWSGVGKMPIFLKGKNLELYKINNDNNVKYRYTTVDGEVKTWSGVGRKPKDLEQILLRGFPLENFKV